MEQMKLDGEYRMKQVVSVFKIVRVTLLLQGGYKKSNCLSITKILSMKVPHFT